MVNFITGNVLCNFTNGLIVLFIAENLVKPFRLFEDIETNGMGLVKKEENAEYVKERERKEYLLKKKEGYFYCCNTDLSPHCFYYIQ